VKGKLEFRTGRSPDFQGRIFSRFSNETGKQIYVILISKGIEALNFMRRFANIHNLTELGGQNIPRANGCCYTGETDHMVEREL
jgi:hypothetical protein